MVVNWEIIIAAIGLVLVQVIAALALATVQIITAWRARADVVAVKEELAAARADLAAIKPQREA